MTRAMLKQTAMMMVGALTKCGLPLVVVVFLPQALFSPVFLFFWSLGFFFVGVDDVGLANALLLSPPLVLSFPSFFRARERITDMPGLE